MSTQNKPAPPDDWAPAFPGQRPPFAPGNELTMKHGAQSPRRVDPLATQLQRELLANDEVAYLRSPRFAAAVRSWATAEAKVALIAQWVAGMDIEAAAESGQGKTSPLELLRKWETTAANHRARLGLDPMSAARLGKDVAQGKAADAAAALTAAREKAERRSREENPDD